MSAAMGRYKPYPECKDSGVDWLGEVPATWKVSKVKYLALFQVGWTPPSKIDANFVGDNLWANISDIKSKVVNNTAKNISDRAASEASMSITPKGSLLYSFKLSVGAVGFAGRDMYTNEAIASFLDLGELPLSYQYYAFPIMIIKNAATNIYGANILNQELISNADLLAPPFEEARTIASFLDHETGKIDALIEEQERLITLLKEKRQAVISHAVTKGLNPDVPMRPSGIEWLGDIPAHWKLTRVKHQIDKLEQGWSPECENNTKQDDEWGVLKAGCVNRGIYNPDDHKKLPTGAVPKENIEVHQGDIIICRASGSRELIGSTAYVHRTYSKLMLSDKLFRPVLTKNKIHAEFFTHVLASKFSRQQIEVSIGGAEGLANNITKETIKNIIHLLPGMNEQVQIVSFINKQNLKLDGLVSKAQSVTALLSERRTALISAAVTGKIDVRDWEPPKDTKIGEEAA